MFEPGASGDAGGVEPVALELHHAMVESGVKLPVQGGKVSETNSKGSTLANVS
ncbi:MAG TPA: hypothetical protein VHW45_12850 [Candidatus Sulfotelmatobacter sp.]|jgi:hypothetical protein|nr:hypothetical protein [Candidatus Sulfotelmatobacter sp.]